ncbi:hypothetical protein B0H12DRAFT_1077949 [Mycena haematopus]|nr:hypothetical protein B0H12DRAFT_1077949 [Mycena haematopus]
MYNTAGYYYRSGSVISISSSRSGSLERSYLDSNPLRTPLSNIFDAPSSTETTNVDELELQYPDDTIDSELVNVALTNSPAPETFESHVERFSELLSAPVASGRVFDASFSTSARYAPGLERTRDPRLRPVERRLNTPYRIASPIYVPSSPPSSPHVPPAPPSSGTHSELPRGPRNPEVTYTLHAAIHSSHYPTSVLDYIRGTSDSALREDGRSVLWNHPVRAGPAKADVALQALQMALDCSLTYSASRTGDDPRDLNREAARKASRNELSAAETYYNVERPGQFMLEEIRFLDAQSTVQTLASSGPLPPFLNGFLPYLRSVRIPGYLAYLCSDGLLPQDFLLMRQMIWEILSENSNEQSIRSILHTDPTPFMFRTIPYSPKYRFGRRDPFTIACAGIRQLIESGLLAILNLLAIHNGDAVFVQHYLRQCEKRSEFRAQNRFPICFYLPQTATPPVLYPADLKVDPAQYHAFIHPYEHDFLLEAARIFKHANQAKLRALSVLLPQLLGIRFDHHSAMSHLFSAGILATAGKVDIFADEFDYGTAERDEPYYS